VHFRNDFPSNKGKPKYSQVKFRKNKIRIKHIPVKSKSSPILAIFGENN
jgi:hypothetical protein